MRSLTVRQPVPSSAPTGRRLRSVPDESGTVVQGAGLTRRQGPHARLEGGAGAQIVHHRVPPGRTDAAAWGAGRVNPRPEQAERPSLTGSPTRQTKEVSSSQRRYLITQSQSLHSTGATPAE